MKSVKTLFAFLLIFILSAGTAAAATQAEAKSAFTTQELLDDYDQMWDILYESFPFLSLAGKSDAELEALRLENRALIGARVTDASGLYLTLQQTCRALGNIAHLRFIDPESYSFYRYTRSQSQYADLPDAGMILHPQTVESYRQLGSKEIQPPLPAYQTPIPMDYLPEIRAAYLRFPSFNNDPLIDCPVPIADFLADHPDAKHVILDIAGNIGGFTSIWMRQIVSAFPEETHWQAISYACITDAVAWAYADVNITPIDAEASELPGWVKELGMTHQGKIDVRLPLEDFDGRKVDKPLRRWLLVDGRVVSAAEMFTRFCKDTGWATVVGTATKGDGVAGSSPCLVRLNHTGLLFRFMVESGVNADGTPNVIRGTQPDFIQKPNETALDACIRLIKNTGINGK